MRKLILLLCLSLPSFGAIPATVWWDVNNSTGNDANGGGFDSAKAGTFQATEVAFSDLICAGTTCTSVTLAFGTTSPGNILNVQSGSGCTTGRAEVISQATGTATFDHSLGTGTCTGRAYGKLASVCASFSGANCTAGAIAVLVGDYQNIWLQYTGTPYANNSNAIGDTNSSGGSYAYGIWGYNTSHGDINKIGRAH